MKDDLNSFHMCRFQNTEKKLLKKTNKRDHAQFGDRNKQPSHQI